MRRQEQKSIETRQALMEATIRLLLRDGYSRLTTIDIAFEAGISRGALTHHFASKEELVTSALEYQLRGVIAEMKSFTEGSIGSSNSPEEMVDYLWKVMSSGLYYTTLEYLPELRHNPSFRSRMIPVVREFHTALDEVWSTLARPEGLEASRARVMLNATMCLIRGMVGQTIVRDDAEYFRDILDFWTSSLRLLLRGAASSPHDPERK